MHWKVNICRFGLLTTAAIAAACATHATHVPQLAEPAPQAANPSRYIYVTDANLPDQCYRDLGIVQFDEPYSASAVDPDGSVTAGRIRQIAAEKYPNAANAVINLHSEQNDIGTVVRVTGEAVQTENQTTVECVMRDIPGAMDATAAAAAGGIGASVAGGLIRGSTGATDAGVIGASTTGAYEAAARESNEAQQRQQLLSTLTDQQRKIVELQAARSSLLSCQQLEIPMSRCPSEPPDQAANQTDNADYSNASQFELERQVQEQQDYINHLNGQIVDLKESGGTPAR